MSQIIQKRPETRKLLNYKCSNCNFNLKTHFKTIKCLSCGQLWNQPKHKKLTAKEIKKKKRLEKKKTSGINKVF